MKIAIDINGIEQPTGLGNYLRLFISTLLATDQENEYFLYSHGWKLPRLPDLRLPDTGRYRFVSRRMPDSAALFAEYSLGANVTEMLLADLGIDLFHGPGNIVPKFRNTPSVLTLHHYITPDDPFFPKNLGRRELFYFKCMGYSVKSADHVLCDSGYTLKHVTGILAKPTANASVAYPGGPGPEFRPAPDGAAELRAKYGLPQSFLLFSGPMSERKNLPRLLEAVKLAGDRLGDVKLAVTGVSPAYYPAEIRGLIEQLGIADKVIMCGVVPAPDMPRLYSAAAALVYPSLFEGFGYPPLEAFQCGCPVAASNAASIPEITGKAALLFDPSDAEAMAECLVKILNDEELRLDLVQRGFAQAGKFSWTGHIRKTIETYKMVRRQYRRPGDKEAGV